MDNKEMESDRIFSDVILRDSGNVVVSNTVESEVVVDTEVESWIAEAGITTRFDCLVRTEDGVMFEYHLVRFIEIRTTSPWMRFFGLDWLRCLGCEKRECGGTGGRGGGRGGNIALYR